MPGTDKTFEIHYGSVNSGSDMGLIAGPFKLSDNCIEADVTYDFATNKVVVTETKFGASVSENAISYFSATPAICCAGTSTTIKTHIDLPEGCTPKLRMGYNYTEPAPVVLCELGNGDYTFTTPTLEEGIYTFTIDYTGSNEQQDVQTIKVKVKPAFEAFTHELMVNPYESIDWDNINRYKANFHAHTSQSFDTELKTNEVVDLYHEKGYDILALTDHDANPYPWTIFNLFNIEAENRDPETLNMLTIPAVELSKNNENSWNESTGSEFNHHNDFFTGRKGQEFATLRESYAYTNSLGGMQIINHPGQYWSLDKVYTSGEKNSPEWHAENFNLFESLVGLEVYNQGNRRPNDRILWDQILDLTMPQRPVWGYSNDDSHNISQYYRNYEFMLMPELTVDALKEAMRNGHSYFSYEYNGSGDAKAPRIENITVNKDEQTITVTTDCEKIYWISGTDISDSANPGSRQSTVLTTGKTFCYKDFQGSYVRALLVNDFGETCTQPFGFDANSSVKNVEGNSRFTVTVIPNPVVDNMTITSTSAIKSINITNMFGQAIISDSFTDTPQKVSIDMTNCEPGIYLVTTVDTANNYNSQKVIVK